MSGGSLDYAYARISEAAASLRVRTDNALYQAFAAHLEKVSRALYMTEWVLSGDKSEGEEVEAIRAVVSPEAEAKEALQKWLKAFEGAAAAMKRLQESRRS